MIFGILHWQSVASFFFLFISYIITNSFLQYYFYYKKRDNVHKWKIQSNKDQNLKSNGWWLPLVSYWCNKERGPYHGIYATFNLTLSCCICAFTVEMIMRGKSRLYFNIYEHHWLMLLWEFILPHIYQGVLEYYWHRFLHSPLMYKRFHKVHHYYKSPEPFDDMYIHPFEAFAYYIILFSPALVIKMHISCFLVYMAICGITGIMDHSGIRFVSFIYNTEDHDAHHSKFECNYSFPFPILDIIHDTYYGKVSFFGYTKTFIPKKWRKMNKEE